MKTFKEFQALMEAHKAQADYRGEHSSPDPESGTPLHNLKGVYPDDFHSAHGAKHYGDGSSYDHESHSIISSLKDRPKASVKIYRAVPHEPSHEEKVYELESHKRHILKTGKVPSGVSTHMNSSQYYDHIHAKLQDMKANPPKEDTTPKHKINPGDWVSVSKHYAKEHGESHLNGKYKIL
jgi:hypothetical protein